MNALNDDSTVQKERKALSREWALMSFYSEEKLEEALKLPNSGKTVGNRLNYFRQVEYKDYDVRQKLKFVKSQVLYTVVSMMYNVPTYFLVK